MANFEETRNITSRNVSEKKKRPDSYYKIMDALQELLLEKDFNEIKWTDLATKADVNTGLIYRYYKDLKNVLFSLHEKGVKEHAEMVAFSLRGIEGSFNKIRKFIWLQIHAAYMDPAATRVQFLEVRAHNSYLKSSAYKYTRKYIGMLRDIINKGIEADEIRDDVPVNDLLRLVFGMVEQVMLAAVLFKQQTVDADIDERTDTICKLIFPGLKKEDNL